MKEKRKFERFSVKEIFVTEYSTSEDFFKVIDISEGGLAFYSEKKFGFGNYLDICTPFSDICLGAEVANINQLPTDESNSEYSYRIGCKFQPWVSNQRITQLIERFRTDE